MPAISEVARMENFFEAVPHKLQVSYQLLFEKNPLPMWVYDVQSLHMLAVNEAALAQYGYSKQEFVGLTLLDLCRADDAVQLTEHLQLPTLEQPAFNLWQHRHRNGDVIEVETFTENLEFDGLHARLVRVKDVTAQHFAERALSELALRLTTTLESLTDAFFTLGIDGCFTYVNARAEALLKCKRAELLGFNVLEKFPEAIGTIFQREFERATASNVKVSFESFYDPLGLWLEGDVYPSVLGLSVYCRDVSHNHKTEQLLCEERETLDAVIRSTDSAIISTDKAGRVKLFNPAAERIFGRTQESMQGQSIEVLLPERFRAAHAQHLGACTESRGPIRMMGVGRLKGLGSDGQEIDLEGQISQVTVNQQPILIANLKDVTDHLRTHAEFDLSQRQLSELIKKLMTQEKRLVKRLAQALHDQLGQTMTAIRMAHETIITLNKSKVPPAIERVQTQMGKLISQAIGQVRKVLIDLRPPLLDELGLAAALDNELRNRALTLPQIDISVEVLPEIALIRWPTEVEYAAFMVAREAVENALRHSRASSVSVQVGGTVTLLQLVVLDNGVGIAAGAMQQTGHLGIINMQEQSQAIGATVCVGPGQELGTFVSFKWECAQ